MSTMLFNADEGGDLDELDRGEALHQQKWASGSLYDDSGGVFRLEIDEDGDEDEEAGNILLFLLNVAGGLYVGYTIINHRNLGMLLTLHRYTVFQI